MKKVQCEICGGHDIIKQSGEYLCRDCGARYSVEEARKLVVSVDQEDEAQIVLPTRMDNNVEHDSPIPDESGSKQIESSEIDGGINITEDEDNKDNQITHNYMRLSGYGEYSHTKETDLIKEELPNDLSNTTGKTGSADTPPTALEKQLENINKQLEKLKADPTERQVALLLYAFERLTNIAQGDNSITQETLLQVARKAEGLAKELCENPINIEKALHINQGLIGYFPVPLAFNNELKSDREMMRLQKKAADELILAGNEYHAIFTLLTQLKNNHTKTLEQDVDSITNKLWFCNKVFRERVDDQPSFQMRLELVRCSRELAYVLMTEYKNHTKAQEILVSANSAFSDIKGVTNELRSDCANIDTELATQHKKHRILAITIISIALVVVLCIIGIYLLTRGRASSSSPSSTLASSTVTPKPTVNPTARPTPVPTAKPTPRPTPVPTPTPTPYPVYNGKIIINPDYKQVCPFSVDVGTGQNYYIRLKYIGEPTFTIEKRTKKEGSGTSYNSDIAFYVKSGQTVEIDVPIGEYKLYYACGETFYGPKLLFGDNTACYTSSETLEFYTDSEYYRGVSLTLYSVYNGNYSTQSIDDSSFPTD